MDLFDIITVLITLSAFFAYVNHRYLRLQRVIGLLLFGLFLSFVIVVVGVFDPATKDYLLGLVRHLDFNRLLLHGMLAFLLFAGPLNVDADCLLQEEWVVLSLATLGVLLSTGIVAFLAWVLFWLLGSPVPLVYCLLFGALISPTDPVAVLAIMQKLRAPEALQTEMAGESLFNDGIGVVIFVTVLQLAYGNNELSAMGVIGVFLKEALGGVVAPVAVQFARDAKPAHELAAGRLHPRPGCIARGLVEGARSVSDDEDFVTFLPRRERRERDADFGDDAGDEQLLLARRLHRLHKILVVPRIDVAGPGDVGRIGEERFQFRHKRAIRAILEARGEDRRQVEVFRGIGEREDGVLEVVRREVLHAVGQTSLMIDEQDGDICLIEAVVFERAHGLQGFRGFVMGRGGEFHFAKREDDFQSSFMLTTVQPLAEASSQALSSLPMCEVRS